VVAMLLTPVLIATGAQMLLQKVAQQHRFARACAVGNLQEPLFQPLAQSG
jgi:hypothetical protein